MTLNIYADWPTGIDESGGNQVVADTKHDVSSFSSAITGLFNDQLEDYYGNTATTLGDATQLAGNPDEGGPVTGNDVVVEADGNVTGLSLTDENGDLYDGTYNSGLTTLDDHQINLLSGTDDNFVLGIDSVTNDVVFMIYVAEEKDSELSVVGGDFYVALFENINHGDDGNDFDGVLDLLNKLYVSAEQIIDFDFAGAPSGQNAFMAFESNGVTIVATGEFDDDSVNSGQGANLPDDPDKTALGTNSQDIGKQELLNFNYTVGFNPEYIVPDLTPTEASDPSKIQFTDVYDTTGAAFNVVKVTGGPATTTPLVTVTAWETEDAASSHLETGTEFISGHGDDTKVAITKVYLNGVDVTSDDSIVTLNSDGSVTVIGAVENDRIKIETTDTHNRISIKNDGNNQVSFSVQAFALESARLETTEVGSQIDFYDDGPLAGGPAVELDVWEDALTGGNPDGDPGENFVATGNLSGIFDPGTDVTGLSFGAAVTPPSTVSSVQDPTLILDVTVSYDANITVDSVFYQDEILLSIGSTDHIRILVNEDGDVRKELLAPLDHSAVALGNPDDDIHTLNIGHLFSAFDGDTDYVTFDPTDVISTVEDDAPEFSMALGTATLETDDGALSGGNSGGTTTDTEGLGDLFTVTASPGADGDGGIAYSLVLGTNTTTNLVDTATKEKVELSLNAGVVEGKTETSGDLVFTLAVAVNGDVTLTQSRAVQHSTTDTSSPYDGDVTGLGVTDAVWLKGILSDGEPTPDTADDMVDISGKISFTDDGPEFTMTDLNGALQTDDGALFGGNAGGTATDTEGLRSLFNITTNKPGADGDGGVLYTLELGVNAGLVSLVDTETLQTVVLSLNSRVVEGRTSSSNDLVFTLGVDAGTGAVTLTQNRAVQHSTTDTSLPYNGDVTGLGAGVTDAIRLVGTLSDGETLADTASDFIDITDSVSFTDDGPSITVNDASGNYLLGAEGTWTDAPGADGFKSLGVELLSYEINSFGVVDLTPDLVLTSTGPGSYEFTITDDFNGDGKDETIDFDLVFNGDGTYDLTVDTPPASTTTFDTSQGSLDAGGPDPVRTLTIGTNEIVFSAVDADTSASTIDAFLNQSEGYIEANALHLSPAQINVSTSGIANGNNVFEGNALKGTPDGATTQGGKIDESFVVDPSNFLASSVTVYIDNSVGGYNTSSEELYYRVYDADGLLTDWSLVTSGHLSPEPGGQVSFEIGDPKGPNYIDAIQLGMGTGTVKIPVIEFTTSTEFEPEPISLNLEATLTDGDDDTFSDGFDVDLAVVA